jgi:hypothetical protein
MCYTAESAFNRKSWAGTGPLAVQAENGRDRWTARHPVSASVELVITYPDGSLRTTSRATSSTQRVVYVYLDRLPDAVVRSTN